MSNSDFDPNKGEFGIGNGINEYNDQDEKAKASARPNAAGPERTTATGGDYDSLTVSELHQLASDRNIEGRSELTTKADLVKALKKSDSGK